MIYIGTEAFLSISTSMYLRKFDFVNVNHTFTTGYKATFRKSIAKFDPPLKFEKITLTLNHKGSFIYNVRWDGGGGVQPSMIL